MSKTVAKTKGLFHERKQDTDDKEYRGEGVVVISSNRSTSCCEGCEGVRGGRNNDCVSMKGGRGMDIRLFVDLFETIDSQRLLILKNLELLELTEKGILSRNLSFIEEV